MKRTRTLLLLLSIISATVFTACSTEVVEPPPPTGGNLTVRTSSNIQADTALTGSYTYFRFSDSSVVAGNDTNSVNWDIAFKGTTIIINGGPVRPGNGGVVIYRNSNFDSVSVAPETGYAVDQNDSTLLAIPTGSGNGWYSYDFANNYVTATPGVVLIIKTGDGKYAKVEILSYYKDQNPQPFPNPTNFRYYTIKFVYQSDGSKSIK